MFHLPRADQFIRLTYHQAERWYREHVDEAFEIIQSLYLIEKTPLGKVIGKVDMIRGNMKEDIGYSIILLSIVMGLAIAGHLITFMFNLIKTIRQVKIPLDWTTTLSKNLCEQLRTVKEKRKFYMTSYMIYLLTMRAKNYPRLYKKCSMQDPNA